MSKVVAWLLYVAFLASVILTGWDVPLRVHFVSKQEAAAIVHGSDAASTHQPDWMLDEHRWDTTNRAAPVATPAPIRLDQ